MSAEEALREIAVDVVLADDLPLESQLAALWQVVKRHASIARLALESLCPELEPLGAGFSRCAHCGLPGPIRCWCGDHDQ